MKEYCYVKLLLYAYPKLGMLAEAEQSSAEIKAALSYRAHCDAFTTAVQVADRVLMAERLRMLRETLKEIISEFTEEERFLFEYKYVRRKSERAGGEAEKHPIGCSIRTYFRLQQNLLAKVAAMLMRRGYTRKRLSEEFGTYSPFRRVYRALKEGREQAVIGKRRCIQLDFCQNSSDETGRGRFPRRMNTITASTASAAAQIATICTGVGTGEGSSVSEGGGSGVADVCSR